MKVEDILNDLLKLKEQSELVLAILSNLEQDPLFVFYEHEEGSDMTELNEWFFENDVVAKREYMPLDHPSPAQFAYHIHGYRFKDSESAIAFKLRWT